MDYERAGGCRSMEDTVVWMMRVYAGEWEDSAQRFLCVQSFLVKHSLCERKKRHDFKSMLKKWGDYFSAKCTMEGECHWRLLKLASDPVSTVTFSKISFSALQTGAQTVFPAFS